MDHTTTNDWNDLLPLFTPDATDGSHGLPSSSLYAVTDPNARPALSTPRDAPEENPYHETDEDLTLRKKACVSLGDKIAFVIEFKLQGQGICPHIGDAVIQEFYDDISTREASKKLRWLTLGLLTQRRTVSNALYNENRFKKLEPDPRVSRHLPMWALDRSAKGTKSAHREKEKRARLQSERGVCPKQTQNRRIHQWHPYEVSRNRRAQEIAPFEVHDNAHRTSLMLLDSEKASFQAGFDTCLPYWQSPLTATHDADTMLSAPVLTRPLTEAPNTVWSSASLTDVEFSEFGDMARSPLFSPASTALKMATPNAALLPSPNISPLSCKTSRTPQINQPEEQGDAFMFDFDSLIGSGPRPPCVLKPAPFQHILQDPAPSSALGIEISLDQLLGFDSSFFLASGLDPTPSALERNDEPALLIDQELEVNEEIDLSLQFNEWLHDFSGSSNLEDTLEQDEPTTLNPGQLMTFDQILDLILGEQPTLQPPNGTAELDNLAGLPPTPGRSTIIENVQEEMNVDADFEEYLRACGLLE
ncbi:hypothetical protein M407DRAFT_8229 [Tulasnella calospora MUT 4182]|uniref:Uncharacterized protein n=1 Tax=Tulasnella calospora MUT 4182 TaxID=1051891 RepID=A0A0C3QH27_9AGAM|nr:hypothetical protein M407DRAFT_8229 [Tulasnella calospora MUT 4182]